ncbi:MAG: HAMP domain-containing histidine kinase [Lachnospiraceae bacterium]|nr:HAMP domain-containing histidine kinase [Lachnospiraceae bacterium]
MVKTLQKRFIKVAMLAVTLLLLAVFIALNIYNYASAKNKLNSTMDLLSEYKGDRGNAPLGRPEHLPPEYDDDDFDDDDFDDDEKSTDEFVHGFMDGRVSFQKTDRDVFLTSSFFMVRLNSEGKVIYSDISQISSLTGEAAAAIALEVFEGGVPSGRIGTYMYNIIENTDSKGHTLIFLDTSAERENVIRIALVSLGIAVGSWLIMFAFVFFLSKKAIRPVAENMERQKQFVTNAGHELKTPLAVIQSNTEAMELFNGENKWSRNIKTQVARLNDLTKNLLTLSRMDESADTMAIENLNFSELVKEQLQTFASSFEQKGLKVSSDIRDDIFVKGDRGQLTQLLGLLFDNTCKYANDGGSLDVSLSKSGQKVQFISKNTCDELPAAAPDKLFDRFYRSDESHSQKVSGQGIGLSVAAVIAQNHRGSICAEYDKDGPAVSFILKI